MGGELEVGAPAQAHRLPQVLLRLDQLGNQASVEARLYQPPARRGFVGSEDVCQRFRRDRLVDAEPPELLQEFAALPLRDRLPVGEQTMEHGLSVTLERAPLERAMERGLTGIECGRQGPHRDPERMEPQHRQEPQKVRKGDLPEGPQGRLDRQVQERREMPFAAPLVTPERRGTPSAPRLPATALAIHHTRMMRGQRTSRLI